MKNQIKYLGATYEMETIIHNGSEFYKGIKLLQDESGKWIAKNGRKKLPYTGDSKERLLSAIFAAEKNGNRDIL
jgi:hypothetical protein